MTASQNGRADVVILNPSQMPRLCIYFPGDRTVPYRGAVRKDELKSVIFVRWDTRAANERLAETFILIY